MRHPHSVWVSRLGLCLCFHFPLQNHKKLAWSVWPLDLQKMIATGTRKNECQFQTIVAIQTHQSRALLACPSFLSYKTPTGLHNSVHCLVQLCSLPVSLRSFCSLMVDLQAMVDLEASSLELRWETKLSSAAVLPHFEAEMATRGSWQRAEVVLHEWLCTAPSLTPPLSWLALVDVLRG